MPKDKNNGREMTPDEKFRSFFSTTAVDIPEEMTRRDENQPEEKPQKRFGLFGRGKEKQETDEAAAEQPQEMPTGEVRLGEDAQPEPKRRCHRFCHERQMCSRNRKRIWN